MEQEKYKTITFRLFYEDWKALKSKCEKDDMTISQKLRLEIKRMKTFKESYYEDNKSIEL